MGFTLIMAIFLRPLEISDKAGQNDGEESLVLFSKESNLFGECL